MDNLIEFAKEQCEIFPKDSAMGWYLRETLKILESDIKNAIINDTPLPKGATNGDAFVPMFQDLKIENNIGSIYMHGDNGIALIIDKKWWNAPYGKVEE